jgi:hypothetical protein
MRLHQDEVLAALRDAGVRRKAAEAARKAALRDIAELLTTVRAECEGTFSAAIRVSGVSRRTAYLMVKARSPEPGVTTGGVVS